MLKAVVSRVFFGALLGFSLTGFCETLFTYDGKPYKAKDLNSAFQQKLFDAEEHKFRDQLRVVEDAVLDIYFKKLAEKSSKSASQIRKEKMQVAPPTDAKLKEFYEKNRSKIPYPFEQVKADLVRFVTDKSRGEKREAILAEIRKSGSYKVAIKRPKAPVVKIDTKGFYQKGKLGAKVKVVEFADYKCPHCKLAFEVFEKVMKKHGKKIEFTFIDFPIIKDSYKIAEASFCAKKQNKYWQFHKAAFKHQADRKLPKELAKIAGLDEKAFTSCFDKREGQSFVDKGRKLGEESGVSGTPTVFINGVRYTSAFTEEAVSKAIEALL